MFLLFPCQKFLSFSVLPILPDFSSCHLVNKYISSQWALAAFFVLVIKWDAGCSIFSIVPTSCIYAIWNAVILNSLIKSIWEQYLYYSQSPRSSFYFPIFLSPCVCVLSSFEILILQNPCIYNYGDFWVFYTLLLL